MSLNHCELMVCRLMFLTHSRDEADEFVEIGALNGIFVLGRSMGFIGEYSRSGALFMTAAAVSLCNIKPGNQTCTCLALGHYLDQKRLKQGLYRHPWDDISYVLPEHMSM